MQLNQEACGLRVMLDQDDFALRQVTLWSNLEYYDIIKDMKI